MSCSCEIFIPDSKYFSVYAEGIIQNIREVENGHILKIDFSKCFSIYYTFNQLRQKYKKNRRLYICCNPQLLNNENYHHLDYVDKDVAIINTLRSRALDEYKMSIKYLIKATEKEVLLLPPQFFWQLAECCKQRKNNFITLELLTKKYNSKITFKRKNIKWH